ncbi:hypothetical protein TRFO_09188 [Tritrichomonas foetus]|uniref:SCP domain-containing protein n=1 Tax=Tritrichomonas foetus TaxID=1144522 RepID=A0A1J4JF11_9EUKA|nr:hypothetical protein TRFO_09188 [Tritrichomonas foetus]|eukprot:OHS97782.1 hypothetical protein TRFO_09188 [Tritrichomonas foetus]
MSKESLRASSLPEKVLRRVYDLINEVRKEYELHMLTFSKELSFLAGEHACQMSTNKVPYGHDGFYERESQAPLATAFSENIAVVVNSEDPGQDIVVTWLKKSKPFSRILAGFTHTGIGVAESKDGLFYCCQILATYKVRLSYKDQFLLMSRYVNRVRSINNLTPLSISLSGAAIITYKCKVEPSFLSHLTNSICNSFFYKCSSAEFISETISNSSSLIQAFIEKIQGNEDYLNLIKKEKFSEFIFAKHQVSENEIICIAIFGTPLHSSKIIPKIHFNYPSAYLCLQIVNDYRIVHSLVPFELSHQWCKAADKHSEKMMSSKGEIEIRSISKKLLQKLPEDNVHCAACVIPNSVDPLKELLLMWISNPKTKARLLSEAKHFGFAMSILNDKFCYVTRIIGTKKTKVFQGSKAIRSDPNYIQYMTLTSEEAESPDNATVDAQLSFRLTG